MAVEDALEALDHRLGVCYQRVEQSMVELIRSKDQQTLVIYQSSASEDEPSEARECG